MSTKVDDFNNFHVHSDYSILDGFSKVDEYLAEAKRMNQRAIAITDHGNTFGIYSLVQMAKQMDIKGVPGCEFYVAPVNPEGAKKMGPVFYGDTYTNAKGNVFPLSSHDVAGRGAYLHLTVIAYNTVGMRNLFLLSSLSNKNENSYRKPRIDFDMLAEHSEGLVVFTGCPSSEISTRFLLGQDKEAYDYAGQLLDVFGRDRLFVEIMDHDMGVDLERKILPKQLELAKKMKLKLLATNDAHYAKRENARSHEELLAIQSKSKMSDKPIDEGGTRFAFSGEGYYLTSGEEMYEKFPERDFPGAIKNTSLIADMVEPLSFDYDPTLRPHPRIPDEFHGNEEKFYRHLLKEGLKERYGDAPQEMKIEARERVKKELDVIVASDFTGYMLTVRDYVNWTKDNFSIKDDAGKIIASAVGPGRGCFAPGNQVRTSKGLVSIENICEGDLVVTHDGTLQPVKELFRYQVKEKLVKLTLSSGRTITCTQDHKIYKDCEGFVAAGNLAEGDVLVGMSFSRRNENTPSGGRTSVPVSGDFHSERFKFDVRYSSLLELDFLNYAETNSSVSHMRPYTGENTFSGVYEVSQYGGDTELVSPQEEGLRGVRVWDRRTWDERSQHIHNLVRVDEVELIDYEGPVYDVHVDKVLNYTLSDVTVHNSVGGSIHAYLLGISETCPITHDLIFERFLSAGRGAVYQVEYDDGSVEIKVASDEIILDDGKKKYTHQVKVGDVVKTDDEEREA